MVVQLTFYSYIHTCRSYSTYIYIYISKEQRCNKDQRGVGNFKIERELDSYGDFSEGQLNVNGL